MGKCWCFMISWDSLLDSTAKFVRSYANLREVIHQALTHFRDDVTEGCYPDDSESYHWTSAMRAQFEKDATRSS